MNFGDTAPGIEPVFNVTQLIDVVLLLLFFFMISTTFGERPGLDVSLPRATTAAAAPAAEVRAVVTAAGEIYLGGERVADADLGTRLRVARQRAATRRKEDGPAAAPLLVIEADRQARHGVVVRLMDAARQAGFEEVSIAVDPAATGAGEAGR